MYNDQVRVPLLIRTPMGGRRGYGPTHSQTLEKLYLGIPGLKVLAPCCVQRGQDAGMQEDLSDEHGRVDGPGNLLLHAILKDDDPVLFIENKLMYLAEIHTQSTLTDFELSIELHNHQSNYPYAPTYIMSVRDAPPADVTLSAYGYMAELARQAVLRLAYEHEIFTELIIPTQLSPYIEEPVIESVRRTGRLLTVEEGSLTLGWGTEVLARVTEALGPNLRVARRLAAQEVPIPASGRLEEAALPGLEEIVQTVKKMV
jgi:pyruvate/2-oxoglutarate/acetoin dehydrogenase E1 component